MKNPDWEVVLGLEIHCQLSTETKIFSPINSSIVLAGISLCIAMWFSGLQLVAGIFWHSWPSYVAIWQPWPRYAEIWV